MLQWEPGSWPRWCLQHFRQWVAFAPLILPLSVAARPAGLLGRTLLCGSV